MTRDFSTAWLVLALATLAADARPLGAQESEPDSAAWPAALREGQWGLSFGIFEGGSAAVGFHRMTTPRTAFTFDFSGSVDTGNRVEESDSFPSREVTSVQTNLSLQPGLRRYLAPGGSTATFGFVEGLIGVSGYFYQTPTDERRSWAPVAGASAGLGIEWFVTDALSLRGEAGLSATYSWYSTKDEDTYWGDVETRTTNFRFGLYRSGIAATIHF